MDGKDEKIDGEMSVTNSGRRLSAARFFLAVGGGLAVCGSMARLRSIGCISAICSFATGLYLRGLLEHSLASFEGPAGLVHLAPTRDCQCVSGYIFRHCRTSRNISSVSDGDGRNQRRIAAYKHTLADPRWIFS